MLSSPNKIHKPFCFLLGKIMWELLVQQIVRFRYAKELNSMDLPYTLLGLKLIVNVQDANTNVTASFVKILACNDPRINNVKCH